MSNVIRNKENLIRPDIVIPQGIPCDDQPVKYMLDRSFVYVKLGEWHFTTEDAWFEYLRCRKETPKRVEIFDTQCELRENLFARYCVVM